MSGISLTSLHRDFLSSSSRFRARAGTQDSWSPHGPGGMSKAAFKDQFIAGYSDAFRAASAYFDLPLELVASVAHAELGNDDVRNDLAYALRAEAGRNLPDAPLFRELNRPRDETSFGPYNIQQRRAAEILGYGDISRMSETARRTLVPTTRDPVAATFMLAKHLSDLRTLDFPGVAGKELSWNQMLVVATRYLLGPDVGMAAIRERLNNGRNYLQNWDRVKSIILDR